MPDAPKSTVSETPTLESSLLKEIEKTGFPAEIISAGYFRDAEWLTLDHSYYIDRDENKGREIDALVAKEFVASNDRRELKLHLGLAVEVKTSRQKPWVVFSSTKASTEQVSICSKLAWFAFIFRRSGSRICTKLIRSAA